MARNRQPRPTPSKPLPFYNGFPKPALATATRNRRRRRVGRFSCIKSRSDSQPQPALVFLRALSGLRTMSTPERDLIVGGQAVIEGVMMRTPNAYAIAVRKADGSIVNTAASLPKWSDKFPILKLPVLRGGAVLMQSMGLGIKALNYSAGEAFAEAEVKAAEVKVALSPAVI